eukprot:gnl/MRDRNA2_/MRDRNA2_109970_c0_seq1.p1 gnl/MRDRNA2_/MRDRNA2_109970_c0~~gnl/MRDRNA2_/MRDRNA2_109970_c0_seq1.p1  ORF type:complete len:614 (+),score=89.46 gnl/MRDRNA2_/MRDRNA2_109970_c0_seq1:86-1927(+)
MSQDTNISRDLRTLREELYSECRIEFNPERPPEYVAHSQPVRTVENVLHGRDFDQALAAIRTEVRSSLETGVQELKAFVRESISNCQAEMKLHMTKSMGDTETALKSIFRDNHTDFYYAMSTWNSQIKGISDTVQAVNQKLDSMPYKQTLHHVPDMDVWNTTDGRVGTQLVLDQVAKLSKSIDKLSHNSRVAVHVHDETTTMEGVSDHQQLLDAILALDAKVLGTIGKLDARLAAVPSPSDTGPFLDAVSKLTGKFGSLESSVMLLETRMAEMKKGLVVKMDVQPVIDHIDHLDSRHRGEINQVVSAVANIKPSIDMGSIVDAVYRIERPTVTTHVDLKPVLDAIKLIPRSQLDLTPVINHIDQVIDQVNSKQRGEIHHVLSGISIDMKAIAKAISQIEKPGVSPAKVDVGVDLQPVLDAIRALSPPSKVDVTPILEHMDHIIVKQRADLTQFTTAVINAINMMEKPMMDAIATIDIRNKVDLQPVSDALKAIESALPRCYTVDLSPVLAAIQRIQLPPLVGPPGKALRSRPRSPSATRVGGGFVYEDYAVPPEKDGDYLVGSYSADTQRVISPAGQVHPQTDVGDNVNLYRVYQHQTSPRRDQGPAEIKRQR